MLLFEAIVLGRPVVSVQPGLIRENTFEAGVAGYAPTLTDAATAASSLERLIRDASERTSLLADHDGFTAGLRPDSAEAVMRWLQRRTAA